MARGPLLGGPEGRAFALFMARRPNAHSSAGRAAGAKEMLIERLSPRGLRKPAASRAWLQTSHSSGKAGAMSPTRDLWLGQR